MSSDPGATTEGGCNALLVSYLLGLGLGMTFRNLSDVSFLLLQPNHYNNNRASCFRPCRLLSCTLSSSLWVHVLEPKGVVAPDLLVFELLDLALAEVVDDHGPLP